MSCLHIQIIFFLNVPPGPDYMLPLPADHTHSPKHGVTFQKIWSLSNSVVIGPKLANVSTDKITQEIESGMADYHTAVRMTTNFETHVKILKCCKDESIAFVGGENPVASKTWLGQNKYQCCYLNVMRAYRILSCPTPSLKPKLGSVRLLVVSQEHLNRICFIFDDVKAAKGKWYREKSAEFYSGGFGKLFRR
jgi:hypothetical protein